MMLIASKIPLVEIATMIAGLALAIATLFYIRAVNGLGNLIRRENPGLGLRYYYFSFWLICGLSSYDVHGERYPQLLRRARHGMMAWLFIFTVLAIAIGWFSRGITP